MEQARSNGQRCADSQAHHHVSDLADRGEGQHALQIGLHHGVHDAHRHGDGAHPNQNWTPGRRPDAKAVHARSQIHTGRYVTGRVQEGAYRSWGRHGLRNPGMQRKLHGLGHQRHQHQQKDSDGEVVRHGGIGPQSATRAVIENQDGSQQSVARNVGHQQHLARAVNRLAVGVPESHQAERAQPNRLPTQIEEEQVGAVDQSDKAADEDQHRGVEAGCGAVVRHVSDGIQEYESAEASPHQSEKDAERVHVQGEG